MDQKPQNVRAQLAEALVFVFRERQLNHHEVGRRCQVSVQDVGRWLDGSLVPAPQPWGQLRSRWASFAQYQDVWERARKEEQQERELVKAGLTNGHRVVHPAPPATTSMGDKLREALQPINAAPPSRSSARCDLGLPPTTERDRGGRVPIPPRPGGAMSEGQRKLREDFVRDFLRARPDARATGNDSVLTAVRKTFGVGITPAIIEAIRREVRAEQTTTPAAPIPVTPPIASSSVSVPTARTSEADIADAVAIVVDTVPGLRRMVIEVDPATGTAAFTYEVQAVTTGGGSVAAARR